MSQVLNRPQSWKCMILTHGNVVDALNHRLKDELLWRCVHNVYIGMQMRTHIHCTIIFTKGTIQGCGIIIMCMCNYVLRIHAVFPTLNATALNDLLLECHIIASPVNPCLIYIPRRSTWKARICHCCSCIYTRQPIHVWRMQSQLVESMPFTVEMVKRRYDSKPLPNAQHLSLGLAHCI